MILIESIARRIGQLEANGFFWQRRDAALLRAALTELLRLKRLSGEEWE